MQTHDAYCSLKKENVRDGHYARPARYDAGSRCLPMRITASLDNRPKPMPYC
jgi:hypothetical protein